MSSTETKAYQQAVCDKKMLPTWWKMLPIWGHFLDYVSDYQLESTCKDAAPCIAPSRVTEYFWCFSGLLSSHRPYTEYQTEF